VNPECLDYLKTWFILTAWCFALEMVTRVALVTADEHRRHQLAFFTKNSASHKKTPSKGAKIAKAGATIQQQHTNTTARLSLPSSSWR
jgi:hypothetical protein